MIFFFYGPNMFALRHQVSDMISRFKAKTGSDLGLDRIDGSRIKPTEIAILLQAVPFLASSRLIIIEGISGNKEAASSLAMLFASVPKTTVAVFTEREIDQRTVVFKLLRQADQVVKFDVLSASQISAWAKEEVSRQKGKIERLALQELLDSTGGDQWRLEGEILKLVNFNPEITLESVRTLVTPSIDQTIFEMVESMSAGRQDLALLGFRNLLSRKENEMYILNMIQWQVRNLLLAKISPNLSAVDLAKQAGMSPYVAGKMLLAQRKISEEALIHSYILSAECELNIKSGRKKSEVAVEMLIYDIAHKSAGV